MRGRPNPFVASEGVAPLLILLVTTGVAWHFVGLAWAGLPALLFILSYLLFRDPLRGVPAAPLGVISPVDGVVVEATTQEQGIFGVPVHRVLIRVNGFGTYTARCPVEGNIMDAQHNGALQDSGADFHGLWVQTDEGNDVLLHFFGHRFGVAPLALFRYGERAGQGERCAYLRLVKFAEVQFPENGRLLVEAGQRVTAGIDMLGSLPPT